MERKEKERERGEWRGRGREDEREEREGGMEEEGERTMKVINNMFKANKFIFGTIRSSVVCMFV